MSFSALAQAAAVRAGAVTSGDLIDMTAKKLATHNPQLNAVTWTRFDAAKHEAAALTDTGQPFFGVPLFLKGLGQSLAGAPETGGSRLFKNATATSTNNFVQALQKLGFIIVGQSNVPEFGFKNITDAALYGPARNPWNLAYSPGGSSGGAAALVAAGISPLAAGSDGGGSIRIPASFSGLIGLKPTRGRVPTGPGEWRGWQGASINFALTRTMADTEALLRSLATTQLAAPFIAPPLRLDQVNATRPLRIAYTTQSPVGTPVSSTAITAVEKAVDALRAAGHTVTEAAPDVDGVALMQAYYLMNGGETAAMFQAYTDQTGRTVTPNDIELITWAIYQAGLHTTAADYSRSLGIWDRAAEAYSRFHETYDLLLTPTTAKTAPRIDAALQSPAIIKKMHHAAELDPSEQQTLIWDLFEPSLTYSPFTQQANLTGAPAISLPTAISDEGLPLGIQFTAAKGREDQLLRIGYWFEQHHLLKMLPVAE
ncbi:amidase [Lacticaseibacillus rhamnosus]|uniref:Amidase n=3 Tax=Lacticaseibacillus rhamnosus TaxID=47715 RepID=A0AAP8IZA2_LACRH|nr:amidase [Lacticaseibacillus rhamnosus]MBS9787147.1 amidase [Lacticaseibacillus rhamnosus]MCH5390480.1 amidase [Lacticaseibacillus rhamnosus]MCI1886464.1 amidase [Lacticaseibacillus rhamnosus]MDB7673946.1 amidase [Lacticaseibacillus rhamnosus]MDB7764685.1 amidase [Lacticaseibacillus rhamnosus]